MIIYFYRGNDALLTWCMMIKWDNTQCLVNMVLWKIMALLETFVKPGGTDYLRRLNLGVYMISLNPHYSMPFGWEREAQRGQATFSKSHMFTNGRAEFLPRSVGLQRQGSSHFSLSPRSSSLRVVADILNGLTRVSVLSWGNVILYSKPKALAWESQTNSPG